METSDFTEAYSNLLAVFLSPVCCTEKEGGSCDVQSEIMSNDLLLETLRQHVSNVDEMLDRTGSVPVSDYILSTYSNGLPLYGGNPVLQLHLINSLRLIFEKVFTGEAPGKYLVSIAEAYQSCQAEQGRVIDHIYGELTGRDMSLRDQILVLVDNQKQMIMDQVVNQMNPNAWKTSDANPMGQLPHIQNSYRVAVGETLGLRGVSAARMDYHHQHLDSKTVTDIENLFRSLFSVEDLVLSIMKDVNDQDPNANRIINREALTKWAADSPESFDSHSLFYNEEAPDGEYEGSPTEENKFQPYLSKNVTIRILQTIFLAP